MRVGEGTGVCVGVEGNQKMEGVLKIGDCVAEGRGLREKAALSVGADIMPGTKLQAAKNIDNQKG